jgi:hypothetical protein
MSLLSSSYSISIKKNYHYILLVEMGKQPMAMGFRYERGPCQNNKLKMAMLPRENPRKTTATIKFHSVLFPIELDFSWSKQSHWLTTGTTNAAQFILNSQNLPFHSSPAYWTIVKPLTTWHARPWTRTMWPWRHGLASWLCALRL